MIETKRKNVLLYALNNDSEINFETVGNKILTKIRIDQISVFLLIASRQHKQFYKLTLYALKL